MELLRFRVTGFRSVDDSDWIDSDSITALIGTNESGKTNLLLALWKLNPAKEGAINAIADYPRKRYNEIRSLEKKPVFVRAEFALDNDLVEQIVELTGAAAEEVSIALVQRKFDGNYVISFPGQRGAPTVARGDVVALVNSAHAEIVQLTPTKAEESLKAQMLGATDDVLRRLAEFDADAALNAGHLSSLKDVITAVDVSAGSKRSAIVPRFGQLGDALEDLITRARKPSPSSNADAQKLVLDNLLSFVYYSNYGNLDSEIYLPHVIENMKRDDLGSREEAKTRTLRVLFDFVNLSPEEILELGREALPANRQPTVAEIQASAERKKEREILLQSASSMLTGRFRDWWRQGEYRIRFQADGNHFRIWVSDDRRPEEIELEGRSAGLQWFLSFYLVFLVESAEGHVGSMLLLDEPGHSLHPLAQKDLSDFFESLATTSQLIYTTHSPFLVDANHLDRVKAVFVDDRGTTSVSPNLRAGESKPSQTQSIYPVHAALGLSVSEMLLQGCRPVIVEGTADQLYLSTIKNYLIAEGEIAPKHELLFIPAGGAKGVSAVVAIMAGKDETLPHVIIDSDEQGRSTAKKLSDGLYQAERDKLISTKDFCGIDGSEIEDLIPAKVLAAVASKYLRTTGDADLEDVIDEGRPIVPQIEAFATRNGIALRKGWKVELATALKLRFQRSEDIMEEHQDTADMWKKLFELFTLT